METPVSIFHMITQKFPQVTFPMCISKVARA